MRESGWSIIEFCGVSVLAASLVLVMSAVFSRFNAARSLEDAMSSAFLEARASDSRSKDPRFLMSAAKSKLEKGLGQAARAWGGEVGAAAAAIYFDVNPKTGECAPAMSSREAIFLGYASTARDLGLAKIIASFERSTGIDSYACLGARPALSVSLNERSQMRYMPEAALLASVAELDQSRSFFGRIFKSLGGEPVIHVERIAPLRD